MGLRHVSAVVCAAALSLAAARSGATVTDSTAWYCAAEESLKVSGQPKETDAFEGVTLEFDGLGGVEIYLPDPDEFYQGTVTAKGATGFLVTPDPASIEELRLYVADRVLDLLFADSVDITSFTFTVKGKVRDGELRAVLKAKGRGVVTIGERTRKGAGKLVEKLLSLPPG